MTNTPSVSRGWAGLPGGEEFSKRLSERFAALKQHEPALTANRQSRRGSNFYRGTLPDGVNLTAEEIAIICDAGNCCFGSMVRLSGRDFECTIWTD